MYFHSVFEPWVKPKIDSVELITHSVRVPTLAIVSKPKTDSQIVQSFYCLLVGLWLFPTLSGISLLHAFESYLVASPRLSCPDTAQKKFVGMQPMGEFIFNLC